MFNKKIYKSSCILISLLLLQGCQENPQEDVVVNRTDGVLESAILESADANESEDSAGNHETAPESYTDSFVNASGDVTVTVDAHIQACNDPMPVVRIAPHDITSQEVQNWAQVLFDGHTAYEPASQLSKSEIEEQVLFYRQLAADRDGLIAEYGSEADAQAMIDYYNQMADSYASMYDSAPETVERVECDWTFHPSDYYMSDAGLWEGNEQFESMKKTNEIQAVALDMEGHTPKIEAVKRNESDFCLGRLSYYYQESGNNEGIPYQEISQEQAEAMAETVMGQLGLENWSLWYASDNSDETKNEYILTYTPTFSGIQTILGPQIDLQSEDLYAASYYYSELTIYIQNGVLTGITLISPFDVVAVENENVSLLSFDEAYQRFRTHMETAYNVNDYLVGFEAMPGFEDLSREVKISGVRQGLFRIKERNNDREFLMVPVWLFSGELYLDGENWGTTDVCIVNGIDGSIINPTLGY